MFDVPLQVLRLVMQILATMPGLPDHVNEQDLLCLGANIYHEARGEPEIGRIAVAWVTLNRVESDRFPDTICEVVTQPGQFSWLQDDYPDMPAPGEFPAYESALILGAEILSGQHPDPTGGADHYFAHEKAQPFWADDHMTVARIAGHTFQRAP